MPFWPAQPSPEAREREAAWDQALRGEALPPAVVDRLRATGQGRLPWTSTGTPADLLLVAGDGIRPLATVMGTCWLQVGRSWAEGHADGWQTALTRLRMEACHVGANAVVDVKLRTLRLGTSGSLDLTLVGTAIRVDGLTPGCDPVIATVSALAFGQLIRAGIVPVGLATGAAYRWMTIAPQAGFGSGMNMRWNAMSDLWEMLQRGAIRELEIDASRQGNGVLARLQVSQLLRQEVRDGPDAFLGQHVAIGTVVDVMPNQAVPQGIALVRDARDGRSPLDAPTSEFGGVQQVRGEREVAI